MKNKRRTRNIYKNNGVTMISLIVTIIVMLILASVAIRAAFREDGMLDETKGMKETGLNYIEKEKEQKEDLLQEYYNAIATE